MTEPMKLSDTPLTADVALLDDARAAVNLADNALSGVRIPENPDMDAIAGTVKDVMRALRAVGRIQD